MLPLPAQQKSLWKIRVITLCIVAIVVTSLAPTYAARHRRWRPPTITTTTTSPTTTTTAKPVITTTTEKPVTTTSVAPTTTTAAPTTTLPSGNPIPVGQSGSWSLKFSDEFNGTSLDTSKWTPTWFGGMTGFSHPINDREDNCYGASQVSVSSGSLNLRSATNTDPACKKKDDSFAPYKSGLVSSNGKFSTTYGYFEARIFSPGSGGKMYNWPAFWTDGQNWPENGEIDIMEALSDRIPNFHYHYGPTGTEVTPVPGGAVQMDGTGWHVYAAQWRPGMVTFYYDGKQVGTITSGVVSSPHYIILNHNMNENYSNGALPDISMLVDYVRVWN